MNKPISSPSRARQAGFTLVEMMVAVTIGLVVLFGMTGMFVSLKNTFKSQDSLGQLQDNERLSLTFLTTAVNEAGYYPDPTAGNTIKGSTVAGNWGGTMADQMGVFGTKDGGGPTSTETLQTAYASQANDGLISCIGTTGAAGTVRNIFYVDPATNSLMCKVYVNGDVTDPVANKGVAAVLINGVQSMSVQYGLVTTASPTQIALYKTAPNMAAGDWTNVKAVRVTLSFVNPFDAASPLVRTHTINVMN